METRFKDEAMRILKRILIVGLLGVTLLAAGCAEERVAYGREAALTPPWRKRQVWAVAPMVNLSGQKAADPILQADLVFQQLQQVPGLTVIPVNRTVEVLLSLRLEKVQSEQQAALVCELLGCDGLVVPTITIYDPYNPPKLGASLQVFLKPPGTVARPAALNPREMARQAAPVAGQAMAPGGGIVQAVNLFDAQNGSVRAAVQQYASGRNDPAGPLGAKEYLVSMDRYCGFVYHLLIADLLNSPRMKS